MPTAFPSARWASGWDSPIPRCGRKYPVYGRLSWKNTTKCNMESEENGAWTFNYLSEDGNGHSITIIAHNLLDAVDQFTDTFGESTSFIVSV